MKTIEIAMTGICAALYAVMGYVIYLFLPITTPGVGIVRFWPNVVIPAIFAVLFGPLVGGFGAAIGIFISDILIHGDPLLSLSAGVTSNFICFYLLGDISRRNIDWSKTIAFSSIVFSIGIVILEYVLLTYFSLNSAILFISLSVASYSVAVLLGQFLSEWRSYGIGSMLGLGLGSTIIGLVVWGYSQILVLPPAVGGGFQLPLYVALIWLVWTFATEIPFLIVLGPPILKACYRAFPNLRIIEEKEQLHTHGRKGRS
jgi:uncharacterized membrane protein